MRAPLQEKANPSTSTVLFHHRLNNMTYTYDPNGNLISKTDNTNTTAYTLDSLNRLTAIDLPNTTNDVQFGYNGNNERISKTVGSVTTQYLIDSNQSLPQIIQETTGTQTTSYCLAVSV